MHAYVQNVNITHDVIQLCILVRMGIASLFNIVCVSECVCADRCACKRKGSIPSAQPQSRPRAVFALGDNNLFYSASAFTNVLIST